MKEFYEFLNQQTGETLFFGGVFVLMFVYYTFEGIAGIIKAFKHKPEVTENKDK